LLGSAVVHDAKIRKKGFLLPFTFFRKSPHSFARPLVAFLRSIGAQALCGGPAKNVTPKTISKIRRDITFASRKKLI
jgi:hypothetical protein